MGRPKKGEQYIKDPRLAAELRRLRMASGMTGDALADKLGWSPSKVSRTERSLFGVTRTDLTAYLRALGVPGERGQAIFALAATAAASDFSFPGGHFGGAYRAGSVLDWSPGFVPWVLQTVAYTRALLMSRQSVARLSPGQLTEFADAVGAWQHRLEGQVTLRAVLSESVLYRQVGTERTMRAQLVRLSQAGGRDTEIRILPEERGEAVGYDAFTYLEYPEIGDLGSAGTVLTYRLGSAVELIDDESAWEHKIAFDVLWAAAEAPGPAIKRAQADAWGDE